MYPPHPKAQTFKGFMKKWMDILKRKEYSKPNANTDISGVDGLTITGNEGGLVVRWW